jgi:hypothetical protein
MLNGSKSCKIPTHRAAFPTLCVRNLDERNLKKSSIPTIKPFTTIKMEHITLNNTKREHRLLKMSSQYLTKGKTKQYNCYMLTHKLHNKPGSHFAIVDSGTPIHIVFDHLFVSNTREDHTPVVGFSGTRVCERHTKET